MGKGKRNRKDMLVPTEQARKPESRRQKQTKKRKLRRTGRAQMLVPAGGIMDRKRSKILNKPQVVNTAAMQLEEFGNLGQMAQHNLSMLRPGVINTPFVEDNGTASLIPTTVNHGQFQLVTSGAALAKYSIVTCCPIFGLTAAVVSTGVGYVDNLLDTSVLSDLNIQGLAYSDVYGATTFTSKILSYATRVEVTFAAPEATINGVVYIGELPYSSFYASPISTLIDGARETVDLKKTTTFEVKSVIKNRQLIHYDPGVSTSLLKEEMVTYAIFSEQPATALDGSTGVPYTVSLKLHSNTLWWPVNSTPTLNGIAVRPSSTIAPTTPAQDAFNQQSAIQTSGSPWSIGNVMSIAKKLLAGASAIPMLSEVAAPINALITAVSSFATDPLLYIPRVNEVIVDMQWFLQCASARWPKFQSEEIEKIIDNWYVATNGAIVALTAYEKLRKEIVQRATLLSRRLIINRNGHRYAYFDNDGNEREIDLGCFKKPAVKDVSRDNSVSSKFRAI